MVFSLQKILLYISMIQSKVNTETRGRPRKEETRTLSPIYKTIFSDNSAIIHTSFLIYVFEVFVDTKNEKRVGHKDGGFTIYDRIDSQYCFDNIEEELILWQCNAIAKTQKMKDFMKLLPALGPKIILKQICRLINSIVEWYSSGLSEELIFTELTHPNNQQRLNELYPYMRFVPLALHQLKIDRNQRSDRSNSLQDLVKQRVNYLWEHLQKIIIHTIFNCIEGNVHNKYFKPFFSDAENPSETHIGQLNLDQVVRVVRKQENNQKSNRGSEYNIQEQNIDKLRKMRSMVDSDGTRTVVHVIKAPEVINFQKSTSQNIGVSFGGPLKTTITDKIFSMGKQKVQNQDEEKIKKEVSEINAGFKSSSWKPAGKQQHRLFSPPLVNSQLKSAIKDDIKKQQEIDNKQFNSSFRELELKSQEYQLSLGNSSEFKKEEREKE